MPLTLRLACTVHRTYVKAVRGERVKRGDVCYGMLHKLLLLLLLLRAAACVDESDHWPLEGVLASHLSR